MVFYIMFYVMIGKSSRSTIYPRGWSSMGNDLCVQRERPAADVAAETKQDTTAGEAPELLESASNGSQEARGAETALDWSIGSSRGLSRLGKGDSRQETSALCIAVCGRGSENMPAQQRLRRP